MTSRNDDWFVVVDPVGHHRPWGPPELLEWNGCANIPVGWSVVDRGISLKEARKRADELNYVEEIMKS
jgi:hypothetical protein